MSGDARVTLKREHRTGLSLAVDERLVFTVYRDTQAEGGKFSLLSHHTSGNGDRGLVGPSGRVGLGL